MLRHYNLKLQETHLNLEIAQKTKLLGVKMTDDLKLSENTNELVKRAYSRMELLRKVLNHPLKTYKSYTCFMLEASWRSLVWCGTAQ